MDRFVFELQYLKSDSATGQLSTQFDWDEQGDVLKAQCLKQTVVFKKYRR